MFSKISRTFLVITVSLIVLLSCTKDENTPNEPINNPPEIQSVSASPSTVEVDETTNLSCVATDADDDNLTFTWSSGNGSFPNGVSGSVVTWKAPETVGMYTIDVNVSDGQEAVEDTLNISVEESVGSGGGEPCPGLPTVTYEEKVYNTVQIGNQCWLKENLNVGTKVSGDFGADHQTDNGIIEKFCYEDDENNCDNYGGLYQWEEAMQYITEEGAQGICPDGWHLPTLAELEILETYTNDKSMKLIAVGEPITYLTPTNETGFTALLAGFWNPFDKNFYDLSISTYFWSSTFDGNWFAYYLSPFGHKDEIDLNTDNKNSGKSVRCLKD